MRHFEGPPVKSLTVPLSRVRRRSYMRAGFVPLFLVGVHFRNIAYGKVYCAGAPHYRRAN